MDHYIDIRLRPDPEFPPSVLMNALYAKLHRALVQLQTQEIGMSFPKHTQGQQEESPHAADHSSKRTRKSHLGDCLRLHGPKAALTQLRALPWLGAAMAELVDIGPVAAIPASVQHRSIRRVQTKSSPARIHRRLVKRLMQREGLSEEKAQEQVKTGPARKSDEPYVTLQSTSTGQRFRLFIAHGPLLPHPSPGHFNAYGLSATATVPWF